MAYEVGTAYLSILPSMKGFGANLSNELGPQMRTAGGQGAADFAGGMNSPKGKGGFLAAAGPMAAVFAGAFVLSAGTDIVAGIKDYLVDAVSSASDLGETVSKSNNIFGQNAKVIEDWAETAATSAGLSKQAALEAASGFGNMFTQLGFAGETAAAMSIDVVQLSADLGSFNNLPTADVADKISAAFRGEYDSLQALIPNINAARVEQEALAATGKTAAAELTAQEKAAAVLAIVHRDGANAANDFAETSDGLANSQKILQAELENVKTEIGTALLPVVTDLFHVFAETGLPIVKELAAWFTENQEAVRAFVVGVVDGGLMIVEALLHIAQFHQYLFNVAVDVFAGISEAMLTFAENLLAGADQAFSWIPGIGPKISEARDSFTEFKDKATAGLDLVREGAAKTTEQIGAAADTVSDLRDRVQSLDGKTVTVNVRLNEQVTQYNAGGRSAPEARATGGPVVAGRPYIVGEREAELFVPDRSGTILNRAQIAALGIGESQAAAIDYDRLAYSMSHVQLGLDGRNVSRSIDQRIGERV